MTEASESLSVLMIDDDEEDIYTMRRAFKQVDPSIHFRSIASSAPLFDGAHDFGPFDADVVILDLNMPVFSGLETLRRLRTGPQPSLVPVVILSTSSAIADAQRCYAAGANAVFTKASSFSYTKRIADAISTFWQTPGIHITKNVALL